MYLFIIFSLSFTFGSFFQVHQHTHGWQICLSNGAANINKLKKDTCCKHLAAPTLISRPMTIDIGMSGKGNIIDPRWRPIQHTKGHLSPPLTETNSYPLPSSRPPCFSLVSTFKSRNLLLRPYRCLLILK
jgi:hypothetical protein